MADIDAFERIARRRRSVRAFLPDPVDPAQIRRAIAIAATAPSSCNSQPWRIHIVSGDRLALLRTALIEAAMAGRAAMPEVEHAAPYRGVYRERQIDAAVRLFAAQGVTREDRDGRNRSYMRNFHFFDAPHAAFIFMPDDGGPREASDCGKFAQTFMLALAAAGVGSCPQGSLSDYPSPVRDILGVVGGRLLLGLSFGYPDDRDATATVRPPRATIAEFAHFHD